MLQPETFNIFLTVMTVTAAVVFIALHYVRAGYGMMYTRQWGVTVNNKLGWVLMEAPVFFAMLAFWWFSDRRTEVVPLIFLILFEIHYFQRSFIFPMLLRGKGKMPRVHYRDGGVFQSAQRLYAGRLDILDISRKQVRH